METLWEQCTDYVANPDDKRRNVLLCKRLNLQEEHCMRVKATRIAHAKYGKSYLAVTIDRLVDMRQHLLLKIFAQQQQNPTIDELLVAGYQEGFSACVEKNALSHDMINSLVKDAPKFEEYCRKNLSFSDDCDDMWNDLQRIVQGREMLVKMYITDGDLFSEHHRELVGKIEKLYQSNAQTTITVIGQVDPIDWYDGPHGDFEEDALDPEHVFLGKNMLIRNEFDHFYKKCGYDRVDGNDFSSQTHADEYHAVYSKQLTYPTEIFSPRSP